MITINELLIPTQKMVLELHIWGPAFGLPSIDAQCLSTVIYLQQTLDEHDWVVVPTSDPRVSPLGELPALRNGNIWVAGFSGIVDYLRDTSDGKWDLNKDLSPQQQADCTALTAFILSRGQPLLDLCLYVSSDNYLNCTRQSLATILSWPSSWTVPHQLRAQAKKRSEHLGLSSLDVDTAQEEENKQENAGLTAQIPKSLRKPKQTVSNLLGKNHQRNRFRLDAVTEDFLEPLSMMLQDKKWLVGENQTSADTLAIGYLSLMQTPSLPHGWLGDCLRKHRKLDTWTTAFTKSTFVPPIDASSVLSQNPGTVVPGSSLPWQVPKSKGFARLSGAILEGSIGSLPVIGSCYSVSEISSTGTKGPDRVREKQLLLSELQLRRDLYLPILASALSMTGLIAWLVHEGKLHLPRFSRPAPARTRFGEAGAFLGL